MSEAKLKPCPFCPGEVSDRGGGFVSHQGESYGCPLGYCVFSVEVWNRRAPTVSAEGRERLVTALLDAAFNILQHDNGEGDKEYDWARGKLKSKFAALLATPDPIGDRGDLVLERDQLRARNAELEGRANPQGQTRAESIAKEISDCDFCGADERNGDLCAQHYAKIIANSEPGPGFATWWESYYYFDGAYRYKAEEEEGYREAAKAAWSAAKSPITPNPQGQTDRQAMTDSIKSAFQEGAAVYELGPIDGKPMSEDQLEKCWNLSDSKQIADNISAAKGAGSATKPEAPKAGTREAQPTEEFLERCRAIVGAVDFFRRLRDDGHPKATIAERYVSKVYAGILSMLAPDAPQAVPGDRE